MGEEVEPRCGNTIGSKEVFTEKHRKDYSMGNHARAYWLIADMNSKSVPLFPVFDFDRASHFAARLQKYHNITIVLYEGMAKPEIKEVA